MQAPDIRKHCPTTAYFSELRQRMPGTMRAISQNTGISYRRLNYLQAGERPDGKTGTLSVVMTYAEQYLLEALAETPYEDWPIK